MIFHEFINFYLHFIQSFIKIAVAVLLMLPTNFKAFSIILKSSKNVINIIEINIEDSENNRAKSALNFFKFLKKTTKVDYLIFDVWKT